MTFEYNVNKNTIEENGEFVAYLNSVDGFRIANKLTALEKENEQLKQENKKLQGKYDYQLWLYNGLGCEYDGLKDENKQLKQRNNRQYEQLGRLYDLIEQKEWRVLTDIIDDFKKSDEQLQKEWETYGDVE